MFLPRKSGLLSTAVRTRLAFALLPVIMLSCGELVSQEDQTGPKLMHIDVTPLIGYRTSITFPTLPDAQGHTTNAVLTEKPSYGLGVGVRLNEEDLVEIRWARQASDIHLTNTSLSQTKVVLNQVHLDCTHEFIMDNWPAWARPYIIGSVGGTHIYGGHNATFTGFSLGLGTGLKVYFNRHVGLRLQVEWLPILTSTEGAVACGAGCVVHLRANGVSQGEVLAGPVFRF